MLFTIFRSSGIFNKSILIKPNYARYLYSMKLTQNNVSPGLVHHRTFFNIDPTQVLGSRSKEYSENKIIGYSMEELYDVVANVDDYKYFVPWCRASETFERSESHARANLEVGFPPVTERYTSVLTLAKPNLVKSECLDGTLFNHLLCIWKISQGPKDIPRSCTLNFYVSFEFKSVLHSQLSTMFFDEVARQMVSAFEGRCNVLYGPSSLTNSKYNPKNRKRMIKASLKNRQRNLNISKKIIREGT